MLRGDTFTPHRHRDGIHRDEYRSGTSRTARVAIDMDRARPLNHHR
ncbi:hypothetical protein MINT15_26410 [Saccharomonospora viridis]|uniref:Uncharacterized protein n=1 Tax=Saccharomonospora viridis TaxID=1852 RepID=A0A837D3Q1_9PSEU|nr:hypothetical protein MINT15_26410 [Saccharomonospora viridis]